MLTIRPESFIDAPVQRCFDLARDAGAHPESFAHTCERVVDGPASGPLELGDTVTWERRNLGIKQRLTARITDLQRPHRFGDVLVCSAFKSSTHIHGSVPQSGGTLMIDMFHCTPPLVPLGGWGSMLFLDRYL